MVYLKINNLLKDNGEIDYKGINIHNIVQGSQHYKADLSFCILRHYEEIEAEKDLEIITEGTYLELKKQITEENTVEEVLPLESRVKELEDIVMMLTL